MNLKSLSARDAIVASLAVHCLLLIIVSFQAQHARPVLINDSKNEAGQQLPVVNQLPPQQEIVKAVSVDTQEVQKAVQHLKQERERVKQAEAAHQQQLAKQAEAMRQQRVQEEQRIAKLKAEAEKQAIAHKKQLEAEQKHLKELAEQKAQEAQRIEAMKREQAQLQQKQQEQQKKIQEAQKEALAAQKEALAAKAKEAAQKQAAQKEALAAKAKEAAQKQAQLDAANQARLAGEVDKYKALIIDAIGRQWILPDNVNKSLSSQFRIRLAPDGGVLEVSLMRSSGDPILDRSAQTAIYKASPLPVPQDSKTFDLFREISLTVRPENVRG